MTIAAVLALPTTTLAAGTADLAHGKYLVEVMGCGDCHTPGYFLGKPDMTRFLGGSDVAFEIPGLGAFVGRNLTPDKATGLGDWTDAQIAAAITTGVRPDGRELAPIMLSRDFATLTPEDAASIVAFLRTIPPVEHAIPGPFGPGTTASTFVMRLLPPGETVQQAPKP